MRLYVSGPMTGLSGFNYATFDHAAADLRSRGLDVVSPAEIKAEMRAAALASHDGDPRALERATGHTRGQLLGDELELIIDRVDCVAVLSGWQRSSGALLETFAAWLHGKRIVHYPSLRKVPHRVLVRAWLGYCARRRL